MKKKIVLLASILFLSLTIQSQIIIPFDNVPPNVPVNSGDTWTESGVELTILGFVDYSNGGIFLGDKLSVDLSTLGDIDAVHVIIDDYCIDCDPPTMAQFFENSNLIGSVVSNNQFGVQTMTYDNVTNGPIDEMCLTSLEAMVFEIIIDLAVCPSVLLQDPEISVQEGDIEIQSPCHGILMNSPDGCTYRIRVANGGALTTELLSCP